MCRVWSYSEGTIANEITRMVDRTVAIEDILDAEHAPCRGRISTLEARVAEFEEEQRWREYRQSFAKEESVAYRFLTRRLHIERWRSDKYDNHNSRGPSTVHYETNGLKDYTVYSFRNKNHRLDGPAVFVKNGDKPGDISFYVDGNYYRMFKSYLKAAKSRISEETYNDLIEKYGKGQIYPE